MEATNDHADLSVSDEHLTVCLNAPHIRIQPRPNSKRYVVFFLANRFVQRRIALQNSKNRLVERLAKAEARLGSKAGGVWRRSYLPIAPMILVISKERPGRSPEEREFDELKKLDEALRETIISAASTVASDFEVKTDALSQAHWKIHLGQLQKAKVDRSKLAAMFSQIAEGLGE